MKLYYSNTSPYSRKVRLVLHEKGLFSDVEHVLINPFDDDNELKDINPLGKIPVLIKSDGQVMYDSPLICQYLDALDGSVNLIPKDSYWETLQWQALADGVMDASYQIVVEQRRPKQEQSQKWLVHWSNDIKRSLLVMQNELKNLGDTTSLAHLSFATALSYLELRLPQIIKSSDELMDILAWYHKFRQRASMLATELG